MGNHVETDKIILLFDNYGLDSRNLHTSFKLTGKDYPVVIIEDDGFLPEGVMSVYEYFLGDFKNAKNIPGKPRYFNQITVPEYWEISANNSSGKAHNLNKERARIFYAEPKHRRLVKVVDWYDDRGVVRSSDHYNKYGALYARTIFNNKGQRVNKSYFSVDGREIIAAFPAECLMYVTQYTPLVHMPYGREMFLVSDGAVAWNALYEIMESEVIDAKELADELRKNYCHFVVLQKDAVLEGSLEKEDWVLYTETNEYIVYMDKNNDPRIW